MAESEIETAKQEVQAETTGKSKPDAERTVYHVVKLEPSAPRSRMVLELHHYRGRLVFEQGRGSDAWQGAVEPQFDARKKLVPYDMVAAVGRELAEESTTSAAAYESLVAKVEEVEEVDWSRISVGSWPSIVEWAGTRLPVATKLLRLTRAEVAQLQGEGFDVTGEWVKPKPETKPRATDDVEPRALPPGFKRTA